MTGQSQESAGRFSRWWVYQRERFPVFAHGPLVLAFSSSAVCFSAMLRGQSHFSPAPCYAVAFVTSLLFFFELRIADEFKDFEEDSRYRPYRPVPRGLVKLHELGWVWVGAGGIQLALALWLAPWLVLVLLVAWLYLGLMSVEFFARDWLKARPVTYLWTHMLIMPLVDLYATACDWVVAGRHWPPSGLFWFLAASFFNGIVIEFGRKIRAPADEENGVQTYSALWGRPTAVCLWLATMIATAACAWQAAVRIHFVWQVLAATGLVFLTAAIVSVRFLRQPKARAGKRIELMAGVWTLILYLSLGLAPLLWRATQGR